MGIAGSRGYTAESGVIAFQNDQGLPLSEMLRPIWLGVALPGELALPLRPSILVPSLLGMDILGRCDFSYMHSSAEFLMDLPE